MSKNNWTSKSRRKVLKAAGSAIAATGLATSVGGASPTNEEKRRKEQEKYERLCEKHRESGNVVQFHRILERNGFNVVQARSYSYDVPGNDHRNEPSKRSNGDVTTMEGYPESDLDVTVSIFEGRYSSFSDMDWEVNTGWWTEGEAPEDNLTLGWSDNHYVYDGQSGSNNVDLLTRNAEGAVWQWDDSVLDRLDTESGYCTAYLDRQATCDKRHVYGTFEHTWEEVEIYSITFGGGGVSITYTDSTKFWRKFPEAKFGGC